MTASTAAATASREPPVAAYTACRRLLRRDDPTFYLAVLRLPADVRPAVHALYGFVRGADEIVDGRAAGGNRARLAALDGVGARARARAGRRGTSDHPVIAALVDAGLRLDLPLDELARLHAVDGGRLWPCSYLDASRASTATWTGAPRLSAASWPRSSVRDERPRRSRGSGSRSALRTSSGTSGSTTSSTGIGSFLRRSSSASAWMLPRSASCRRRLSFAPCSRWRSAGRVGSLARRRRPLPLRCPRPGAACASRVPPTSPSSTASRRSTTTSSRTRSAPACGGCAGGACRTKVGGVTPQPTQLRSGEPPDVLICGASFAGLAVARELAGVEADVLVLEPTGSRSTRPSR